MELVIYKSIRYKVLFSQPRDEVTDLICPDPVYYIFEVCKWSILLHDDNNATNHRRLCNVTECMKHLWRPSPNRINILKTTAQTQIIQKLFFFFHNND